MFTWKNMTPHPIDLYRVDCDVVLATFAPSGEVVRLKETPGMDAANIWLPLTEDNVEVKGWEETENYAPSVPAVSRHWGEAEPEIPSIDGLIYIVPMPVLSSLAPRTDLCCPDFGEGAVRNSRGTVIGTRRFVFREIPEQSKPGGGLRWRGSMEDSERAWKESRATATAATVFHSTFRE